MDYAPGDMQRAIKAKSSFNVNDTLLGNQDPFFWFLPPLFFIISVGITTFCWVLLASIVRFLAGAVIAVFMSRRDLFVKHVVNRYVILYLLILYFIGLKIIQNL